MNCQRMCQYLGLLCLPRIHRLAALAVLATAAVLLCAHAAGASDGGVGRLTDEPAYDGLPSWSAEGNPVTSEPERDGNREGYAMKVASPSTSAATDREALEAFYRATGGDNWEYNSNWMSTDAPIDHWFGVTTDNDGRVVHLHPPGQRVERFDPG